MRKRKTIAFVVITAGVGFCLWSFFSSNTPNEGTRVIAARESGLTSPALQFTVGPVALPSRTGAVLGETGGPDPQNLTDTLIASYLATMKERNPSGPTDGRLTVPSGDTIAALIEGKSQESISFSRFTERDIRVSVDASPAAQKQYIESLGTSLNRRFKPPQRTFTDALDEMSKTGETKILGELVGAISGYVGDMLALPVPAPLSVAHLDWLNLWQERLAAYTAIAEFSADPLKAYIAIKQVPILVERGTQLTTIFNDRYVTLNGT